MSSYDGSSCTVYIGFSFFFPPLKGVDGVYLFPVICWIYFFHLHPDGPDFLTGIVRELKSRGVVYKSRDNAIKTWLQKKGWCRDWVDVYVFSSVGFIFLLCCWNCGFPAVGGGSWHWVHHIHRHIMSLFLHQIEHWNQQRDMGMFLQFVFGKINCIIR